MNNTRYFLGLVFMLILVGVNDVTAQGNASNFARFKEQWQKMFDLANKTAVIVDEKVVSMTVIVDQKDERKVDFSHEANGTLTMTDETGLKIRIIRSADGKINSFEMPNGDLLGLSWQNNQFGDPIAASLSLNGRDFTDMADPGLSGNPCEDSFFYATLALSICAVSPGSPPCWAATANAAYHAYKCWKSQNPGIEEPPATRPNKTDSAIFSSVLNRVSVISSKTFFIPE